MEPKENTDDDIRTVGIENLKLQDTDELKDGKESQREPSVMSDSVPPTPTSYDASQLPSQQQRSDNKHPDNRGIIDNGNTSRYSQQGMPNQYPMAPRQLPPYVCSTTNRDKSSQPNSLRNGGTGWGGMPFRSSSSSGTASAQETEQRGVDPRSNSGPASSGDSSEQLHDQGSRTPCAFFLKTGSCAYGDRCKFDHPLERAPKVRYNSIGLPMRPGEAPCSYYMKHLNCAFGHTCKYDHPELQPFPHSGNVLPHPTSPSSVHSPGVTMNTSPLHNGAMVIPPSPTGVHPQQIAMYAPGGAPMPGPSAHQYYATAAAAAAYQYQQIAAQGRMAAGPPHHMQGAGAGSGASMQPQYAYYPRMTMMGPAMYPYPQTVLPPMQMQRPQGNSNGGQLHMQKNTQRGNTINRLPNINNSNKINDGYNNNNSNISAVDAPSLPSSSQLQQQRFGGPRQTGPPY